MNDKLSELQKRRKQKDRIQKRRNQKGQIQKGIYKSKTAKAKKGESKMFENPNLAGLNCILVQLFQPVLLYHRILCGKLGV